jgi:hypothetical protein
MNWSCGAATIALASLHGMVTLDHVTGQFGNSLFQLAATMSLAKDNNCPLALPPVNTLEGPPSAQAHLETVYQRIANGIEIVQHRPSSNLYVESSWRPVFIPIPYKEDLAIAGSFQNELYFKQHRDWIRSCFAISEPVEAYLQEHFTELLSHQKLVGIHVRTAYPDWLSGGRHPDFYKKWWLAPDMEFFRQAIELFDEDSLFVICSDYPSWCEENFAPIPRNFVFVKGHDFIYDFFLLTKCPGLIIAASTFGWWAAYLNDSPDKQIIYRNPFMSFRYDVDLSRELHNSDWLAIDVPEGIPPTPIFH